MFKSETQISYNNRAEVERELEKTLKVSKIESNQISQNNFFHTTLINLKEKNANIKVTFSKSFYIFYIVAGLITVILPFENALIGSSAFAIFMIFSAVIYFSLDYKLKTILDGFK